MIVKFNGDKIEQSMKIDGETVGEAMKADYKIKDGKLYMVMSAGEETMESEIGKINSFEIVSSMGDETMTLKCGTNIALMIAAAVVAGLGALMTAFCITITVLDRKGKLGY